MEITHALSPPSRDDLIRRLESAITVQRGHKAGEGETRIGLDHLLPSPAPAAGRATRWRLATAYEHLYPPPTERAPLKAWHMADGQKGRRPLASDLRNDNRVAAILAWHPQPGAPSSAATPHLITAAAIRKGIEDPALRAEYFVALWLLVCVTAAIDRKTVRAGRVGLVLDSGIALSASELADFGFRRGPQSDAYRGDYYMLGT